VRRDLPEPVTATLRLVSLLLLGLCLSCSAGEDGGQRARPLPVEVAEIQVGSVALRRTFSGTLEAGARLVLAPRVGGRVLALRADLGDPVAAGQVVAELDDAVYRQEAAASAAALQVARAEQVQAEARLEYAELTLERARALHPQGAISQAELDDAAADQRAAAAGVEVARAGVARAAAELEAARIALADTRLVAGEGEGDWVVAERHLRAGETATAGQPLLTLVDLDPLVGSLFVTEQDYGGVAVGQPVTLEVDAFPGETFGGEVLRVAPAFDEGSRQARVELAVENPGGRLKPGMFARVGLVLERAQEARVVPAAALTRRGDIDGVFLLDEERMVAVWRPVTPGIREGDRVQLLEADLAGRVVTLGARQVSDGAAVVLPEPGE
jgi:RND family efflux transporter MFP subunit